MKKHGLRIWPLLRDAYGNWSHDRAPRLGAALAYYTIFSIAPLLVIAISVAGIFFGVEAVQGRVVMEISGIIGREPSELVQNILVATSAEKKSLSATLIGVVTLLIGATAFFAQLQDALNVVWKVQQVEKLSWHTVVLRYWWSFTMVFGTGFLLLVSLLFSAALNAVTEFASSRLAITGMLIELLNIGISLAATALLFALIFKYIPNVRIPWRDVWFGSALTAAFFVVGKTLLAVYLGRSAVSSVYGAAGALVLILLWAYYSAQILLYGAELTRVVAQTRRSSIEPRKGYAFVVETIKTSPDDTSEHQRRRRS